MSGRPPGQPMEALALANRVRLTRAALRRDIRRLPAIEGREQVARLLDDDDWCDHGPAATATIGRLLQWPVGCGPIKARRLAAMVGAFPTREVRYLTRRQRRALAAQLRADRPLDEAAA